MKIVACRQIFTCKVLNIADTGHTSTWYRYSVLRYPTEKFLVSYRKRNSGIAHHYQNARNYVENMYKICRRSAKRRLAPTHQA